MTFQTWLAFFVAAWLISLSPGPGALASMSAGLAHGFRRGWWNIVGLQLGICLLVLAVALGAGTLLLASPEAFALLKWGGAAYLVWLGIQQWRATTPHWQTSAVPSEPAALVWRAFLINASNPKGLVFMLAVLPQFIDPRASLAPQYLICCATLMFTDAVVMCGYTLLAARAVTLLHHPGHLRLAQRCFGALFVVAGCALVVFQRD